jgi:LysR family transcriptional regulator, low CO2-responsive transcriptional regulator
MNLKRLEVFLAVAESGSFSRGAEATFITQSTVSQHISALEQELGIRLLDRTGKGAMPTEAGKIILSHARRIVAEMRSIPPAINRFKGLEDVSLTVGASNIPGDYMIPEALPSLLQRFPKLAITVLQGDSRDVLEKISREEVEIGVVGSRYSDDAYTFTPLGRDRIILVTGQGHPWYGRDSVPLEELRGVPIISREQGSGTGKTVKDALSAAGVEPESLKVKVNLGSNEGVKHAVKSGIGVSFISEISVRSELERGELSKLKIPGLEITRQFYLTWRAGRELSPAATAFANAMMEIIISIVFFFSNIDAATFHLAMMEI